MQSLIYSDGRFRIYSQKVHLALFEHRHLLLQHNVFLLQLAVVLQKTSLAELVLLDVVTESGPLQLHHLTVL